MENARTHRPAHAGCCCIAAYNSSASSFAVGRRFGILSIGHIATLPPGGGSSPRGNGFGSTHLLMIRDGSTGGVVSVTSVVTSPVTTAVPCSSGSCVATPVGTSAVTTVVIAGTVASRDATGCGGET